MAAYREITGEPIETAFNGISENGEIPVTRLRQIFGALLADNDQSPMDSVTCLPDAKRCVGYYGRLLDIENLGLVTNGIFELLTGKKPEPPDSRSLAPFVPTPVEMVERMLDVAELGAGDVLIDPCCGDGRVLEAAVKRGATAIGYELDPGRREIAAKFGTVYLEDGAGAGFELADVIFLYTLQSSNEKLQPVLLEKCKDTCRIVSHAFSMPEWKPYHEETISSRRFFAWRMSDVRQPVAV